jgi:TolA-binding protein
MKNYKRAVIEFEKVFTFAGTDKDDDAQLKLGHCHRSMGNIDKALEEYQRLIDYFPGSEFFEKARESIKGINIR